MDPNALLARFDAEYLAVNSITPARRDRQAKLIRRLAATLDHPLTVLTQQDLQNFIGVELASGKSPNTTRTQMGMFRSFIGWAAAAGVMDAERAAQLKLLGNPRGSSGKSQPKPYKVSEIKTFRRLLNEKYPVLPEYGPGSRALTRFTSGRVPRLQRHLWRHARRLQFEAQIALALELGLRRVEIFRLSIPELHYDNNAVVVRTAKQGPGVSSLRTVPFTTHARTCVQEWLDFRFLLRPGHERPWLQLDYVGSLPEQVAPLTFSAMHKALRVFGPGWRWHRFRHTAATEWLRSGVPIEKVRIYMGHSSIEQTLAYAHIVSSDIEREFGQAESDFARRLGLAA